MNNILLSFDVEEFDIPEEYGQVIPEHVQFKISQDGLKNLLELLDRLEIKATFFVTAHFALNHKETIKSISCNHEIASHGFYHSSFDPSDLKKSKDTIEGIINKDITGFRMARLQPVNEELIVMAGYQYNASLNPTYLPGRYNNFFKNRIFYFSKSILNIPVSVTSILRFPLFWLSFKNFPLSLIKYLSIITLKKDSYLSIYFHPWEFTNINSFNLPFYIRRKSGEVMLKRLESYLRHLKRKGNFVTHQEFMKKIKEQLGFLN